MVWICLTFNRTSGDPFAKDYDSGKFHLSEQVRRSKKSNCIATGSQQHMCSIIRHANCFGLVFGIELQEQQHHTGKCRIAPSWGGVGELLIKENLPKEDK